MCDSGRVIMPPSTADASVTTLAHFIQKQIVSGVTDEQPGDNTALKHADKLLKPEVGESSEIKNMQPLVFGWTDHCPYGHASLQTAYYVLNKEKINRSSVHSNNTLTDMVFYVTVTHVSVQNFALDNSFCNSIATEYEAEHIL